MKPTTVLLLLLLAGATLAQLPDTMWLRKYGGDGNDFGYCVAEAADEGFVIAGNTTSFGRTDGDALLVKVSPQGDTIWTSAFGGPTIQEALRIKLCPDGGFIICGNSQLSDYDMWVARTDEFGDSLWAVVLPGPMHDRGCDIVPAHNGGFLAVGMTYSYGAGFLDVYIGRVTEYGYLLWTRTVGTAQQDYAKAVVPTPDSCYLIVGASQSGSAFRGDNLYIVKLDDHGDTVWTRVYPSDGPACLNDIVALGDTGYMCVGYSPYYGTDAIMMRLDANGDSMWCRHHGGHELDEKAYDVDVTEDGQFWVAGTKVEPQGPDEDIWVFGANSLGNGTGEFVWGGDIVDRCWGVLACSDGGWIAAGQSWNDPPGPNCVGVKSVPRGNLIRNGDFQFWRSEVDPFGWFADDTAKARVEQCADTVYSPPYSARVARLVAGTGDNAGVQRFIHVDQGEDYTLTARMLDLSDDAAGGIGISWYDAETSYIRSSGTAYTDSGVSDWQELSVTDPAPESAAFARVRVRVYGHTGSQPGGVVYADQVALVKGVTGVHGGTVGGVTQPRPSTIIGRGTLRLPGAEPAALLDITGRKVMDLQAGENDVRGVVPGVYFLSEGPRVHGSEGPSVRKVIVQR